MRPQPVSNNPVSVALDLLTGRRLTVEELRQRLRRRGFSDVECEETVERMTQLGLLNDGVYARDLAADMLTYGKHGPAGIRARLLRRGVASEDIDEVLSEAVDDWQVIALRIAQEYDGDDERSRERLMRRLYREGFPRRVIRQIMGHFQRDDLP